MNVDYFSTSFNLPPNMNEGDLFHLLASNFQLFDDGCSSTFNFLEDQDLDLWNSSNPVGTVFSISIFPDDGSVMVTQFDNEGCYCWTFTTMVENSSFFSDGVHPVSGNRQFGLTQNENGTWTFYTRGVDRATHGLLGASSYFGFPSADRLWSCIMENVTQYVKNLGGDIQGPIIKKAYRPDYDSIEDYINGLGTTDIIKCLELYEER